MTDDFKSGYVQAYTEILKYASSVIPNVDDPDPWIDVALFAHTSIGEIEMGDALGMDLDLDDPLLDIDFSEV